MRLCGGSRIRSRPGLVAAAFLTLAVAGFKKSPWLIVAALVGHGVFDWFHHFIVQNPGVPAWWPGAKVRIRGAIGTVSGARS